MNIAQVVQFVAAGAWLLAIAFVVILVTRSSRGQPAKGLSTIVVVMLALLPQSQRMAAASDEAMARDRAHGIEHAAVLDAPQLELIVHHRLPFPRQGGRVRRRRARAQHQRQRREGPHGYLPWFFSASWRSFSAAFFISSPAWRMSRWNCEPSP